MSKKGTTIPLYLGTLYVEFGNINKIKKQYIPKTNHRKTNAAGVTIKLDCNNWLIAIDLEYKDDAGVWTHEAAHVAHSIFDARGIRYTLNDDEHYCYLLTWIVRQIQSYRKRLK